MRKLTENDQTQLDVKFGYHQPSKAAVAAAHAFVRGHCRDLAAVVMQLGESREVSLALTKIEEAMFWANAAIARRQIPLYGDEDPRAGQTSLLEPAAADLEATGIQKLVD